MVVAIPNEQTRGGLGDLRQHGKLVGVGRGHRETGDDARPADSNVHPEAVEGLPEQRILTEVRLSLEALAAVGASEEARRQGHRIDESKGRVVRCECKEILPEALLDLPEVGRLAAESGPMHLAKGGKPLCVVTAEEEVDVLVGVYPKELSNDLDGKHLGVGELGCGSAPSEASQPFELVVYKAEDRDDEGAKIHRKGPPSLWQLVWVPPSVGKSHSVIQPLKETCTRGYLHGNYGGPMAVDRNQASIQVAKPAYLEHVSKPPL